MSCRQSPYGDCEEDDNFRMLCDLEGDDTKLACTVEDNQRWKNYGFAWRKLE